MKVDGARSNALIPEARFLLQNIRLQENQTLDVPSQLNWKDVLELAKRHSVVPLLYTSLIQSRRLVPPEVLEQLRIESSKIAGRNAVLKRELLHILKLLQQNSFDVIPYKGPVLTETLYGNVGLRHFDDLDILVHKKDFDRVKDLLLNSGFVPKKSIAKITPAQEKALMSVQYTYDFINERSRTPLEVHWRFLPKSFSLDLDLEAIWQRCSRVTYESLSVPVFNKEDLLLNLCIMGAKKSWDTLSRVCDVARLISRSADLDWNSAIQRARDAGAERILLVGLHLATILFEVSIPDPVAKRLGGDANVQELSDSIVRTMFLADHHTFVRSDDQFQPMHYRIRERFSDRFRYCYRLALTPGLGEWNAIALPGYAYWLYYPLRPLRLAGKAARRLLGQKPRGQGA